MGSARDVGGGKREGKPEKAKPEGR